MPRNPYPGKKLYEKSNYFETAVSFSLIINHPLIQKIIKPDYQGSLNTDTVDSLIRIPIKTQIFGIKTRLLLVF